MQARNTGKRKYSAEQTIIDPHFLDRELIFMEDESLHYFYAIKLEQDENPQQMADLLHTTWFCGQTKYEKNRSYKVEFGEIDFIDGTKGVFISFQNSTIKHELLLRLWNKKLPKLKNHFAKALSKKGFQSKKQHLPASSEEKDFSAEEYCKQFADYKKRQDEVRDYLLRTGEYQKEPYSADFQVPQAAPREEEPQLLVPPPPVAPVLDAKQRLFIILPDERARKEEFTTPFTIKLL